MERRQRICPCLGSQGNGTQKTGEEKDRWPEVTGSLDELWKACLLFVICRKKHYEKDMADCFRNRDNSSYRGPDGVWIWKERGIGCMWSFACNPAEKDTSIPQQWCPNGGSADCARVDVLCWWNRPWGLWRNQQAARAATQVAHVMGRGTHSSFVGHFHETPAELNHAYTKRGVILLHLCCIPLLSGRSYSYNQ